MPGWLRNALALVAGIVIGGVVKGLIITLSPSLIPPPAGVDVSNAESSPKACNAIGVIFLCGGIAASFMIPAPGWFIALDLLAAYLPMAWLAVRIGSRLQRSTS